ncbi:MAG: immunoglobulin domain-containing protein, partial [Roseimicrobium sp.]
PGGVQTGGATTTVAGLKGTAGSTDGIGTTVARFKSPDGIAVDALGNLWVADTGNHTLRMITPAGVVSTVGGLAATAGNVNGVGTLARFRSPRGIAVDGRGVLYVADMDNHTLRQGNPIGLPHIEVPPAPLLVGSGQLASFAVTASGAGSPLSYKWLKNGAAITGATLATKDITPAALTDAGTYAVVVTNAGGSLQSAPVKLGVVSQTGGNVTFNEGTTLTLTATAAAPTGTTLTYRWKKNGGYLSKSGTAPAQVVSGTTTSTLSITKVTASNDGAYTCEVTMDGLMKTPGIFNVTVRLKPFITAPAVAPLLVGTGEPASFTVAAGGSVPLVYKWLKNGAAVTGVTGATTPTCTIASAKLTDAGSYSATVTNAAGIVTSKAAKLGVVSLASPNVAINEGTTLTLTIPVAAPAGTVLHYKWLKDGGGIGSVISGQIVSGTTTATLSITKVVVGNNGDYSCEITMDGLLPKQSGAFHVTVNPKPVVNPIGPLAWYVSGTVTDVITAQNNPTTFAFTGLPAGVTGNTATGRLSGKPTTPQTTPKTFSVTATNAAGTSPAMLVSYTITGLLNPTVGTFNGLVDRDTTLSAPFATPAGQKLQGHGGSLYNLVTTGTGTFTGTLNLEDKSYAMPAGSVLDAHGAGNPTASVRLLRGTATDAIADLTFAFTINKDTGELTGTVTDGLPASTPIPVHAWRNPWVVSTTPALNHPATALAGTYTAFLDFADESLAQPVPNLDYPQGNGYGTLTITTAGLASWTGRLADGTPLSCSTTMGPNGEVPLHKMLYTPTVAATAGSAHGWVQVTPGASAALDDNLLDTMLDLTQADPKDRPIFDWMKKPQAATAANNYRAGVPRHKLIVKGGGYVKPPTGPVLGLTVKQNNAKLTFASANIETAVIYVNSGNGGSSASLNGKQFTITNTNVVQMPTLPSAAVANPATLALTLNATTGAFSGSFILKLDPDPTDHIPPQATLSRTVKYYGLLVPRAGVNMGVGYFLLPQLPADGPPKTTLT